MKLVNGFWYCEECGKNVHPLEESCNCGHNLNIATDQGDTASVLMANAFKAMLLA